MQHVLEGDMLDFVDKMIEVFGKETLTCCVNVFFSAALWKCSLVEQSLLYFLIKIFVCRPG